MSKPDDIYDELTNFSKNEGLKLLIDNAQTKVLNELKTGVLSFSVSITPDQLPGTTFSKFGQLIRVYGARAGVAGRVERHPNSFQTLFTSYGRGKTIVFGPHQGFIEKVGGTYWSFVPENIWHQPIAEDDWVCVTFHSAPADKLIDEYKD